MFKIVFINVKMSTLERIGSQQELLTDL